MKSLALLLALSLAVGIGNCAFGEFAGTLNFTLGPGMTQSKQWGIMNTYNHTLNVSLVANPDPSGFIYVTVEPSHIELNASTILYANVTVSSPQNVVGSWSGTLTATAAPQGNQTGEVSIALSTVKKFNVVVTNSEENYGCAVMMPVSPYAHIVGAPCTRPATFPELYIAGLWRGHM